MTLWQLTPVGYYGDVGPDDDRFSWDCNWCHIIRADTEEQARKLAAKRAADEGREVWLDPAVTICTVVEIEGEPAVILSDFHAG